jgi:SecDF, P1 head subdomain
MSDYFDRVERQIARRVQDGVPRTSRTRVTFGHLAVAAAVLVVIVVVGLFLAAGRSGGGKPMPAAQPATRITFTASPTNAKAIDQSVALLRERLHAVLPGATVSRTANRVTVTLSHATPGARGRVLALAAPGRLAFYDWEADVIAPNGKTVASQLRAGNPAALTISRGSAGWAPGQPHAGSMSLHQATALVRTLPRHGHLAIVPAIAPDFSHPTSPDALDAQFYVLRGAPALSNAEITNPRASADTNTRTPDVTFDFTAAGSRAFQSLTAAVARRGGLVSGVGDTLDQHFAIALDNRLITVPYIDFRQYPDGISGDHGADIAGGFTSQSAKDLAILLRYGPLPTTLTVTG